MSLSNTIAAIVTPPGEGGVGIIRISGSGALPIGLSLYNTPSGQPLSKPVSHHVYFGVFIHPETREPLDQGLLLSMHAPRSYTGEDVVELHLHGGPYLLEKVLSVVLASGARLARPGEFTQRAFLNGKMDLTQAEAVIDLIRSKTESSRKAALSQLEGKLRLKVFSLREELVEFLARLEAQIDFPEEIEELSPGELKEVFLGVQRELRQLLETAGSGKVLRQGLSLAIVGRPNVGKSSLLNALLQEDRAIVTEIAGTTRDVIEEYLNLKGMPVRVLDTAGIRESFDKVERLGIERTRKAIMEADLVLFVLNAAEGFTEDDRQILELAAEKEVILVVNKKDQNPSFRLAQMDLPSVYISAPTHDGLKELEEAIYKKMVGRNLVLERQEIAISARHQASLEEVRRSLDGVVNSLEKGLPADFLTIDLKQAILSLGEVTGETVSEQVIERIFADFCVGK